MGLTEGQEWRGRECVCERERASESKLATRGMTEGRKQRVCARARARVQDLAKRCKCADRSCHTNEVNVLKTRCIYVCYTTRASMRHGSLIYE